jgi:hypothetical protein
VRPHWSILTCIKKNCFSYSIQRWKNKFYKSFRYKNISIYFCIPLAWTPCISIVSVCLWQIAHQIIVINLRAFNLLKPIGYVMHQQVEHFNNCTLCLHCIYVFCIYLRTNSDLCHLQHKLVGFCNRDEKCLQRGTHWVFKWSSLRSVF